MMPHVAVMTFSILKAPYGDVAVREFDDRTPDVFAEAETGPGFVARARPAADTAWMTNFQKDWGAWGPFAVPRFYLGGTTSGHTRQAQTLSVWSDLRAVWHFAYRGPLHRVALQDREAWFGPQDWPIYCLWWTDWPAPLTWREACRRLEHLHDHGPTPESFTFHRLFDAEGRPTRLAPAAVPA